VAILENIIVNQWFEWNDDHQDNIRDKTAPHAHAKDRIHEMESRIRALDKRVSDQEIIIAKLENSEEQTHSLKRTVANQKRLLLQYGHRIDEIEAKLSDQEIIITGLRQRVNENDGHQTHMASPSDEPNTGDRELNNSNVTTMMDIDENEIKNSAYSMDKENHKGLQRKSLWNFFFHLIKRIFTFVTFITQLHALLPLKI
jgi:uncharacterized coiled-coil protein SlyX